MTAVEQTISVFLSHASADANAGWIDPLEQELQLRGLAVWRDKHQLLAGHHNWDKIRAAIDACTVFVVVITPRSIKRPAIWDELRHADKRWQADRAFPIIPVRIGVTRDALNNACKIADVHRLSDHQDIEVSVDRKWTPASDPDWAARVAGETLAGAIDRHLALNERELVVTLRTRSERSIEPPDLDLDWSSCFIDEPDATTWRRLLLALEDLADAIKAQTRQERFRAQPQARIGVGVALGWAIPRTSARKIDIIHHDPRGMWPSDGPANEDGHTNYIETEPEDGDPAVGTVLVSIGRDARAMYERSPAIARAGHLLEVNRPDRVTLHIEIDMGHASVTVEGFAGKLKHTFGDYRLCMWYQSDPADRRWMPQKGMLALIDMAVLHLFRERYVAETGEPWPGEEAPHEAGEPKTDEPMPDHTDQAPPSPAHPHAPTRLSKAA